MPDLNSAVDVRGLSVLYGETQALFGVDLKIPARSIVSLIGPSGCGKTTFIRCLNRMNDEVEDCVIEGVIEIDGVDIYAASVDVFALRAKVGMVFQKPNPFPKSIYDNIAYGPRLHRLAKCKQGLDSIVEKSLVRAGLWSEVQSRLGESALALSGGQKQRLCIARAIAVEPKLLLMDEPCSALDPISTNTIEELMQELKERFTIVVITHSMAQARKISDRVVFFHGGKLLEYSDPEEFFAHPSSKYARDYIKGKLS